MKAACYRTTLHFIALHFSENACGLFKGRRGCSRCASCTTNVVLSCSHGDHVGGVGDSWGDWRRSSKCFFCPSAILHH